MSGEPETITLTRHDDGSVTADRWPDVILVDDAALKYSDIHILHLDDATLTITVSNGRAVYAVERDWFRAAWRGTLVESEMSGLGEQEARDHE